MIFFYWQLFRSFVKGDDLNIKVAEDAAALHLFGQTMQDIQRIARQHAFPKTNHIAIVVVFGRLDQDNSKLFERQRSRWLAQRFSRNRRVTKHSLRLSNQKNRVPRSEIV